MKYLTTKKDLKFLKDFERIVGIDEAGRGCWAGPVFIAGFVLRTKNYIKGVNDSKKISISKREILYSELTTSQHYVAIGSVSNISDLGLAKTLETKIQEIIDYFETIFPDKKTAYLIDGQFSRDFGTRSFKIIKGDSTYYSIAAASIIAKVSRDRELSNLSVIYPEFQFSQHKGYGTKLHSEILTKLGPTPIHRINFKPVRDILVLKSYSV